MNFKAFGTILQEMLDYLAGSASALTDFNVGSATRSLMEAVALVLAELHYLGEQLVSRFFVSTATGQWLDMRAAEYGLYRIQAAPTTRSLSVSHAAGPIVTIPVGQQFATLPGAAVQVIYQVTQAATLAAGAASVGVLVISTTAGAATAIPDATDLRQQGTALAYIDAISTGSILLAGTDRETDDQLRARLLDHMQNPAGPGSAADYERAVLDEFAGVIGSVTVIPLWAGPGTVEVLVLGPSGSIPSGGTIAQVQAFLDTWAPIGAAVTVSAPGTASVDVTVTVTPAAGFDAATVRANVATAIEAYIDALGIAQDVLIGGVANAIWDTDGVGGASGHDGGNYTALLMRVSPAGYAAADIAVGSDFKALAGTVTVS